jgi:hypothetical protein
MPAEVEVIQLDQHLLTEEVTAADPLPQQTKVVAVMVVLAE